MILIIDSLNSLTTEKSSNLSWLPRILPKGVKLICSCTDTSAFYTNLSERDWYELKIQPFSDDECIELISTYLGHYGKQIDEKQQQVVLKCPRTRNPLYLVTFLQEVRVFGVYEELNNRMDHYLDSKTVTELFEKVIAHLEEDFDPDGKKNKKNKKKIKKLN